VQREKSSNYNKRLIVKVKFQRFSLHVASFSGSRWYLYIFFVFGPLSNEKQSGQRYFGKLGSKKDLILNTESTRPLKNLNLYLSFESS
jgi:hypothetical protein